MSYEREDVLRGVNFSLDEGEWLSIVGENGSGKTTLLKGIAGLLPLKDGSICFGFLLVPLFNQGTDFFHIIRSQRFVGVIGI